LLRRVWELSEDELALRCEQPPAPWLKELELARRVVPLRIGGVPRYVAVEDVALYRDGLGTVLPPGLAAAYLGPAEQPMERLLLRWARTHGPFEAGPVAQRWGMGVGAIAALLDGLDGLGKLVRGALSGSGVEYCDPDVLRRLRQRTLASLRQQVAPVDAPVFARFLLGWQGVVGQTHRGLREVLAQLQGVALPASQLDAVLGRRVRGYRADDLDQLGAMGEVVWVGRGAVGARDGRIAMYQREAIHRLLDPPDVPEGFFEGVEGALRKALLDHLEQRGASFVTVLCGVASPERAKPEAVIEALWSLAWAGLVTNDTFAPLRQLGARRKPRGQLAGAGGRWSAVSELLLTPATDTEKALARSAQLLERYGVASGPAARAEGMRGGFAAVYAVLRTMEESGKVRRGWFVDGIEGAQFALPGAVDRLRAHRDEGEDDVAVLPATDPANPYGAVLPWPPTPGSVKRALGADVVLVGGEPVLFVDRGGKSLSVFGQPDLAKAKAALAAWVAQCSSKSRIEILRIDGAPVREHAWAEWMGDEGFATSYKGFEYAKY
jgi:ATP-dependent helicase Lhr and Lhr-like helicase